VSKQDSHFFNIFSMVIGVLMVVAIVLFALARVIGNATQVPETYADKSYLQGVEERIQPMVRVAIAGQDNSALAIKGLAQTIEIKLEVPKDGPGLYDAVCKTCHETGLAGAPKTGDRGAWGPRVAQGTPLMYEHAIKGYTGKAGAMPAKGGRTDLNDELIKAGVDYLIARVK
jgi:cytochrome c5